MRVGPARHQSEKGAEDAHEFDRRPPRHDGESRNSGAARSHRRPAEMGRPSAVPAAADRLPRLHRHRHRPARFRHQQAAASHALALDVRRQHPRRGPAGHRGRLPPEHRGRRQRPRPLRLRDRPEPADAARGHRRHRARARGVQAGRPGTAHPQGRRRLPGLSAARGADGACLAAILRRTRPRRMDVDRGRAALVRRDKLVRRVADLPGDRLAVLLPAGRRAVPAALAPDRAGPLSLGRGRGLLHDDDHADRLADRHRRGVRRLLHPGAVGAGGAKLAPAAVRLRDSSSAASAAGCWSTGFIT